MSVLNKTVSYFPNPKATTQGREVSLLKLLETNRHKEAILNLRQCTDEKKQKQLKELLPCYTVAGTFSRRCEEGIKQFSGLAAVDLDSAENYDTMHLLNELKKIEYIAYAGLSCRGKRLFCIVPFKYPELYLKHYERLIKSFEDIGLPMGDTCHKQISQPRFVSLNESDTCFFTHNASLYNLLPTSKIIFAPTKKIYRTNYNPKANIELTVLQRIERARKALENKGSYCVDGNKHPYINNLCIMLCKYGVSIDEAKAYIYSNLLPANLITTNCIESPYRDFKNEFGTWVI